MTEEIKIKLMHENAIIPYRANNSDGGWDITTTEIIHESKNKVLCKLGWGLQFRNGLRVDLKVRSSFTNYNWVLNNSPGICDAGYPDEYIVRFTAIPTGTEIVDGKVILTYDEFPYSVGDRIGQIHLSEVIDIEWNKQDEIIYTGSRTGGYGSTGK